MIKTAKEIIRRLIEDGANAASEKYRDAVRPIYGHDRKFGLCHIGSCFILEYKQQKYLITAAHVVDEAENTTLAIGGSHQLVTVEGVFCVTEAPNGVRDNDHYDFAWRRITDEFYNSLGNVGLIKDSEISQKLPQLRGRVYLGLGYPCSKNKPSRSSGSALKPRKARYYASWREMRELYDELGVSGDDHIAIERKRQSRSDEGNMVNSIGPKGMSGGPLIDLGRMASIEEITRGSTRPAKLAGMLIEHHKKHGAIVSVRIDLIVASIESALHSTS
jgi:hypothetical protein